MAAAGCLFAARHFTVAGATSAHPTTVAQAEARATYLINEAAVSGLDEQDTAELHGLIRRFHLVPTRPGRCTSTKTNGTTTLDCKYKLGFTHRRSAG